MLYLMKRINNNIIIIIFILLLLFDIIIAREDRETRKQKLRSAFRQSLLTADTLYEDIDPSNEEQTATLAPASLSGSLRGSSNTINTDGQKKNKKQIKNPDIKKTTDDPDVAITLESTEPIIKVINNNDNNSNKGRKNIVGLTIEVETSDNSGTTTTTTTVDYNNNKEWKSIRITFENIMSSNTNKLLVDEIIPNVIKTWSNVLSVIPIHNKLYPSSTTCGSIDIPLKHLRDGIDNTDIIIYLSSQDDSYCNLSTNTNTDTSTFAYSSVCNIDQYYRPIVANIALCNNNNNNLQKSLVYEVGRILGLSPSLFQYYRNPETNTPYGTKQKQVTCVDGSNVILDIPNILQQAYPIHGRKYFEVITSTVLQVVRNHFNCQMLSGAKLDNSPLSESCFGGFGWDERYYYQENMTTMKYHLPQQQQHNYSSIESITALSLALLEDSSWYKANYKDAIVPSFGHGAGCGFLEGDCLVSDQKKIPSYSKDFFCSLEEANALQSLGCDVSHLAKAQCDTMSSPINNIFDILKNKGSGIYTLQQTISSLEESDSTYTCPMRTKNVMSCLDATTYQKSSTMVGEIFGPNSKCFVTTTKSAICLQAKCNSHVHKVEIIYQDNEYTCNHPGEKIELPNSDTTTSSSNIIIECPKIETICPNIICPANCSGKGMCDYSLDVPICICDDPFDTTPGCYEST